MGADFEVSLTPPDGWQEVQLDPEFRGSQIAATLAPMKHVVADWDKRYPLMRRYLERSYAQAWQSGVRYAITTRPDPEGRANVMATYMLAVLPSSTPDGERQLDAIIENLSDQQASLLEGERLDLSHANVEHIGAAIKAASIRYVTDEQGNATQHRIAELRMFTPWQEHVIVSTGVTPQIELSDTLFTLFERITSTLRVRATPHFPVPQEAVPTDVENSENPTGMRAGDDE